MPQNSDQSQPPEAHRQANLSAAKLLGRARNGLIKQPINRFILTADQDIFYRLRRALVDGAGPQVTDLRMLNRKGTELWVEMTAMATEEVGAQPEQRRSGRVVMRVVMSDISQRKLAEQALERIWLSLLQTTQHT